MSRILNSLLPQRSLVGPGVGNDPATPSTPFPYDRPYPQTNYTNPKKIGYTTTDLRFGAGGYAFGRWLPFALAGKEIWIQAIQASTQLGIWSGPLGVAAYGVFEFTFDDNSMPMQFDARSPLADGSGIPGTIAQPMIKLAGFPFGKFSIYAFDTANNPMLRIYTFEEPLGYSYPYPQIFGRPGGEPAPLSPQIAPNQTNNTGGSSGSVPSSGVAGTAIPPYASQ